MKTNTPIGRKRNYKFPEATAMQTPPHPVYSQIT